MRSYKEGLLYGNEKVYNSYGVLKYTGEYTFMENKEGLVNYKQFYPDKKLKKKTHLKNNILHGQETTYHPNGKISSITTFNQGIREGAFEINTPEGNTLQKGHYVDNEITDTLKTCLLYTSDAADD